MKNAVHELLLAMPEAEFANTGGGCMVITVPTGRDGAVVVTGVWGSAGDNFSRGTDAHNYIDADLTGFEAWHHPAWYGDDYDPADGSLVYLSDDFDALAGVAWDSPEYPEDEDSYRLDANTRHAAEEVARTADAIRAFINRL